MRNLVLFGPPGAGKGTQSEFLVKHYNLVHLSTGDVFRYNIKSGTELGKLAQSYMDQGELVPDEVVIGMIRSKLESNPNVKGFIFDGFPRTTNQAIALDQLLEELGYGLDFRSEFSGESISPEVNYRFAEQEGFIRHVDGKIPGEMLLKFAHNATQDLSPAELKAAKGLNRQRLRALLGDKPLNSRELFIVN